MNEAAFEKTSARSRDNLNAQEAIEREKVKETLFRQFIETGMEKELFNEIMKAGFTSEEIMRLRQSFTELAEQEKEYVYAFPYELRKKNFVHQAKSIRSGKKMLSDFWSPIVKNGEMSGRALGYHCSNFDLSPKKTKDLSGNDIESWEISGTENDHRNNDLPMAYYSEDYMHLYRTKPTRFLYVISSQRAQGSGHYKDNSNKWGRAPNLSVVQKFNLLDVDMFVENKLTEYFQEKNTTI